MASSIVVRTQRITRAQIAAVTDDPRLIRLLENLVYDVTVSIPGATDTLQSEVEDGPPIAVPVLPDSADDLSARVSDITARLAVVERQVAQIQEDVTP